MASNGKLKLGAKVEVAATDATHLGKGEETSSFLGKVTKLGEREVTISREGCDWVILRSTITSVKPASYKEV